MELESMTALELAAKIRQREVSVLDGVKEVFDQIESKEETVHAYLDLYKKEAYARAKEVEKGIAEAVLKGPLAAYPVIGVKAVLYDGSYHPVDSSEMAFKVAAKQAFKKGFLDAKPVLLEPIASVKIITPEEYTGEIMGDLNKRRGRVMNMNAENGYQEIDADLPYLELYGYNTQLRSMTSGSGTFSYEFARYEQAPEDVAAREIEERAGKVVETEE